MVGRDTGVPLTPPPPPGKGVREGALPPYQVRHAAVALRAAGEKMPTPRFFAGLLLATPLRKA